MKKSKKFRRITTLILSFLLALPFFACEQTSTVEPPEDPTTPPAEEPTDELVVYDDGGKYDAIIDKAEYSWSDSEGLLDGAFSDGETEKDYATFSAQSLTDGLAYGSYSNTDDVPQMSVVAGADLLVDTSVDESIRNRTKGSYDSDKLMEGIEDVNFLQVDNKGYRTLQLTIKPECGVEEFDEADFISFKICIYNKIRNETAFSQMLYFKNRPILRIYRCTWYDIKIPLEIWRETGDGSGYEDKSALYGSLNGDEVSGDRSKGQFLQIVSSTSGISANNDFVAYISDIKLGVEKIDKGLGRNFASLTPTEQYNNKTCMTNTYIYWGTTEKVKTMDESGVNRSIPKYTLGSDGVNIAVIPGKKLSQIQKYDYVYVTMYIETENPFPLQVGINGYYNVSKKTVTPVVKGVSHRTVLVSANKWITYKIPVKGYLERLYTPMSFSRVYTAAASNTVYYQTSAMSLFFINGEYIRTEDAEAKSNTYGMSVYLSRVFLVKE